jgi:hypothetical protein
MRRALAVESFGVVTVVVPVVVPAVVPVVVPVVVPAVVPVVVPAAAPAVVPAVVPVVVPAAAPAPLILHVVPAPLILHLILHLTSRARYRRLQWLWEWLISEDLRFFWRARMLENGRMWVKGRDDEGSRSSKRHTKRAHIQLQRPPKIQMHATKTIQRKETLQRKETIQRKDPIVRPKNPEAHRKTRPQRVV